MDESTASRLESLGYMTGGGGASQTAAGGGNEVLPGVSGRSPRDATTDLFRLDRARELIGRGHLEAGIELLKKIVQNDPGNPQFLLKLAQAQGRAGRGELAERHYREVIDRHPTFFLGYLRYSRFLMNQDRPAEARDLWLHLQEQMPGYVGIAPRLAEAEIAAGQPARAAKRLEGHLDEHGDDALAWAQLGRAHRHSEDAESAERAFREALEIKPTQRQAAEGLVDLLTDQGRVSEARTTVQALLMRAPGDPLLEGLERRLEAAAVHG
jgi:cytochrome c-type biogenesis protein CcmH/NrfG